MDLKRRTAEELRPQRSITEFRKTQHRSDDWIALDRAGVLLDEVVQGLVSRRAPCGMSIV